MITAEHSTPLTSLTLRDGCDRCGPHVRAYVRVHLSERRSLDMCHHHFTEHEPALMSSGLVIAIEDNRDELLNRPGYSA